MLGGVWFACWWNHRTRAVRNTNKGERKSIINGQTIINKNLTSAQTAEYMRIVADDMKQTISTTTTKLNDLDLGLDHF